MALSEAEILRCLVSFSYFYFLKHGCCCLKKSYGAAVMRTIASPPRSPALPHTQLPTPLAGAQAATPQLPPHLTSRFPSAQTTVVRRGGRFGAESRVWTRLRHLPPLATATCTAASGASRPAAAMDAAAEMVRSLSDSSDTGGASTSREAAVLWPWGGLSWGLPVSRHQHGSYGGRQRTA